MNWPLLQNSLLVAGSATAIAVGFGLVAALWLATLEARWRNLSLALAIVALALPPFLVTNCWISLLGEAGTLRAWLPFHIYSLGGTIWILSLLLWPITLFAVLAAWRRLEAAQFESEPAMTGFALLRWLLLPVAKGELALAAMLTFVLALNNFAVPAILQTKVLPDEMWVRFNTQFDAWGALKLSLPLVIAPVLLLVWVARRGVSWPRVQGTASARVFSRQLGAAWRGGCGAVAIFICAFSVGLPLAQIVTAQRTWAELAGAVEASTGAIWNSFWFAALAATVVVSAALASNRREAETRRAKPNQNLVTSAATIASWLAFFIPGVLIGIALIKIFNRPVLVTFYQSAGICLLALTVRYFALAWAAARHAVASVDSDLVDATRLEGASRWQMLRFVVWPQIAPQLFAAWYVIYLLCLWDVESIVLVQPPGGETLALKIFNLLHYGHAAQVNALCVVLLGVAVLPLLLWCVWRNAVAVGGNTKIQAPSTKETSSTQTQIGARRTFFGVCRLRLFRSLGFGIWCLATGCSPRTGENGAALPSRFFERAIVIGSRGVGLGEFNKPRSVTCGADDTIYAVDMTGRVQKFSTSGEFVLSWQMPETTLGKAKGMGRDQAGNILVIEPHYQRVNHYAPDGRLIAQWGCRGTNEGCFILPRGIAQNLRGEFLVSEYMGSERVQRFRVPGSDFRVGDEQPTSNDQHPRSNQGPLTLALSPSAGDRENHSQSRLNAEVSVPSKSQPLAGSETGAPLLLQVIGRAGTGPGEFNRPEGICVDAQDRLYVADSCNHRIQIFSPDGKFVREYGRAGSGLGELSYPYDIAVDAEGFQFVCEFGNSRIQVFDQNCQPVEIIGGPGAGPGRFANPWGVALDSHGNLLVADALNHRLQKLVRKQSVVSSQWSLAECQVAITTTDYGLRTVD